MGGGGGGLFQDLVRHYSFKSDVFMATLLEVWHYVVSARTGWPAVNILGLVEIARP